MKKMILSALLFATVLSAAAQNEKNDSIYEKFLNAKVRELTYRLEITDEQKANFVNVYRKYNDEMRAAWGARHKKAPKAELAEKKDKSKQLSSADVANAKRKQMERQQKAQNVQMKYLDEFAKVLDAKQLNKFYETEAKIQKKLMERRNHPKGKPGMRQGKDNKNLQGKHPKKQKD